MPICPRPSTASAPMTRLCWYAMPRSSADNLNRETLKDAIQSYKGFDGLMGPFEFTEDGAVYRGYKVVQYQDGVLTSVSDYMMVHD